ncbi:MAG: APC family permease [Rhizomicrobium sp.]|jgi:APA family basic amino acid/polyamine antiporter
MSIAAAPPQNHLLRILGVAFGIAIALGSIIGSGILRSPAAIAIGVGSTGVILLLWVIGAIRTALLANVVVELGTALPLDGGAYVFTHRALGDVAGLIVGWSSWGATIAAVAAASVSYANFLAIIVPSLAQRQAGIAVALQIVLYGINIAGLREGRLVQQATSFTKAALLFAFAAAAVFVVPESATAAMPSPATAFGWAAIVGAFQLISGAYAGWEAPVFFSEENEQPASSLPRAVAFGIVTTALLYIAVNWALLHALGPYGVAASPLPFMTVLARVAGPSASFLFALGAMTIVLSCANANIMIAPRIIFALARDRLLPHQLSAVNTGGSPHWGFLMSAVISLGLAITGQFALVFGLIATLNTLAGLLTGISFFVLRFREPALPRPWRALGYPVLPALALLSDAVLLVLFNAADWKGFAAAAALSAACVPFAWIAHRARRRANNAPGARSTPTLSPPMLRTGQED